MEATLLKLDKGKLNPSGDVIVHIETTLPSGSPGKVLTIVTFVQNNVEILNQAVTLQSFSRARGNPLVIHFKRESESAGQHAVQFTNQQAANNFLVQLCQALGSNISEVQIEKSALYAQTGSQGPHLLTVNRGPDHASLSSSIHSNVSDLSHSGTSSGYCSHYWSEVSTSSQLVDGEDTLAPHTHLPSIESESASSASTQNAPDLEEKCQKCRYCSKQFEIGEEDVSSICRLAPNSHRDAIDRLCCLRCYRGFWYHLTKDTLDDDGQDLGKCEVNKGMTISHWCLLGCVSVLCLPCLMLWCPLSLCEYAAQSAGITGGPHSLTTVKKKNTAAAKKTTLKDKITVDAPVDEGIEIDDGSTVHIKVEESVTNDTLNTIDTIIEVESMQDNSKIQRHHSAQVCDMEHKKPNIQRSQSDSKK